MDEFKDSKTALVADVDCTTEGKSLCEQHSVSGYPTIKYGDPSDLKDYSGGRDFNALKQFAEENLGPTCGPDNLDLCDEESKAELIKFQQMGKDELQQKMEEADAKIKKIGDDAQKKIDKLQAKIRALSEDVEKASKAKENTLAKENAKHGLKFMNAVSSANKKEEF